MASEYKDLGFAKLDVQRAVRTGTGEAVYCPGKTKEQLAKILSAFMESGTPVLGTGCSPEQAEYLRRNTQIEYDYNESSRLLTCLPYGVKRPVLPGKAAVCTGGTADIPVAEAAAGTIEFHGGTVDRFFDIGIAGLHRLLSQIDRIREADVVIAVAGMEGALAGVIAGLVAAPVIAVPTSVGYGASFQGIAPLLTMLNSCAEGVSVVNIDNGFGAGILACRMLRMKCEKESC